MTEPKPLQITFLTTDKGLFIGWGMNRDQIDPSRQLIMTGESLEIRIRGGSTVREIVKQQSEVFFNGPLTADLNIPRNYPYEIIARNGNEVIVIASGKLRPKA